ncbi:unnamed protein product [Orchesella dallaii]|uniref:MutS protein 4 n=1 Tax=Orchesella dallaii TaxID=48710 RepID=A0ABP1S991_9HEXA
MWSDPRPGSSKGSQNASSTGMTGMPLNKDNEGGLTSSYFASNATGTGFAPTSFGGSTATSEPTRPRGPTNTDSTIFKAPGLPVGSGRAAARTRLGTNPVPSSSRSNVVTAATPRTAATGTTTPGTSRTVIEPLDRTTLLAVVEGRGQARGEIGIACMNLNTPNLILCQFTDTQSYRKVISKINVFRPYEILMPSTSCDLNNPSQLCLQLRKEVSNVNIVPIQRRIFNEGKGLQKINSLVSGQYASVIHLVTNKYYCLAASSALLKYAELVQSVLFSPKCLKIEFQVSEQTCMIDHVTAQHLELLQNNQQPTSSHCLYGILNSCRTPVGARLLRMALLQPSCDVKLINTRLDCVEELIKDREVLYGLQDILGRLQADIEHVIATLVQIPKVDNAKVTEQRINYVIALKHTLELVPGLVRLMENSGNDYFQSVRSDLMAPQFEEMLNRIKNVLHDEAQFQKGSVNMKRQRCFAVKADVNPILDVARKAYCEIIEDVNRYVIELSQHLNLPLRLSNNSQRGFYIQFNIPGRSEQLPPLPDFFLQVRKKGNVVTFTTESLISNDHRSQEVMKEIENLSGIVLLELISGIRCDIGTLYKISEAIGNLDLIYSLANYALTTPRCVRPSFLSDVTAVTMGRHPILDSICEDPAVPNNTYISNDCNFTLITGPNMSGKTTYIKQLATLQILAQIGSFVPADAASFRIAGNILSRIGTGDNIEENSSSFALELTEMNFILQNVMNNSLIIIDELGRATSIEEGAAISFAIAEELLKTKAFVLFATHHLFLTKLESLYLNILNYKMETQEWKHKSHEARKDLSIPSSKLTYTHLIRRGVTDVEYYGLKLAMNTSYPPEIVANALKIAKSIIKSRKKGQRGSTSDKRFADRSKYLLMSHLYMVAKLIEKEDEASLPDLQYYLESLRDEYLTMVSPKQNAANVDEVINISGNDNVNATDNRDNDNINETGGDDQQNVADDGLQNAVDDDHQSVTEDGHQNVADDGLQHVANEDRESLAADDQEMVAEDDHQNSPNDNDIGDPKVEAVNIEQRESQEPLN